MASELGVQTIQHTNGTDAMTIDSSGNVALSQVGSGNFYRQGTWTPIASSDGATDQTATVYSGTNYRSLGTYERIGDVVHIYWRLSLADATISYTNGGADGQTLRFVGLPFTSANFTEYYPAISVGYFSSWTSWSASYTPMGIILPNSKIINMYHAIGNGVTPTLTQYFKNNGADIIASATYRTDDA